MKRTTQSQQVPLPRLSGPIVRVFRICVQRPQRLQPQTRKLASPSQLPRLSPPQIRLQRHLRRTMEVRRPRSRMVLKKERQKRQRSR